ncbi:hypothetical protein Tco_0508345 [Tanacetum coccineum]
MFLNVDQLEKQLDKEDFQEIGSMVAFRVLETQTEVQQFRDTMIKHMESVKSINKRAQHKQEYNSRVNERQMQTTEEKVDTSNALDANIRPTYDEEPMVEVQTTSEINVFATGQQHIGQPKVNNEGEVDQNAEQCHDKRPLLAKLTDNKKTELSNQSLKYENIWQHGQFLKERSNEAKVKHDIDVIYTMNIELEHKVAELLKENETLKNYYKELYDSIKTMRAKTIKHTTSLITTNAEFKAQLQEKGFAIATLKIITTHYLPKEREYAVVKPHHVIASRESRNSSKNMPRFSSNDMVHNHNQDKAKKKTQESGRNSRPSLMHSARSQSTANDCTPKPRSNTQTSRNWPASKSSCVTTKTVPTSEHSRNFRNFSDSKHFVCLTCQKCVFDANHDSCVTKFLNNVNSRAKVEPTGRIFKTVGLRWVPTGNIFTSSTTKVDSEPPHGSNTDITNLHEYIQNLDSCAGTSINVKEKQTLDLSAVLLSI